MSGFIAAAAAAAAAMFRSAIERRRSEAGAFASLPLSAAAARSDAEPRRSGENGVRSRGAAARSAGGEVGGGAPASA